MKKIIIATAVAAVMTTSIAVYAAANADDKSAASLQTPTQTLALDNKVIGDNQAAAEIKTVSEDKAKEAKLEYTKTSFVFQDSGETIVTETWMDPVTLENRTNYIVTSAAGKIEKNFTYYTNDGAKHHINIFRDENGKAVGGQEFYYSQEKADTNAEDLKKYDIFAGRKAMYEDAAFWTDKGTVTSDGKILKKILCGNEQEGNTTCVYIDEATGFPVKEESYEKGKLISTMTYEFKYADRDGKLFDAGGEGVKLEQLDMNKMSEKLKKITEKNKVD